MKSRTPSLLATSKQLLPITSLARGFAPSLTRVSMVLLCPFCAAMCRGVAKLKSVAFTFPPPRARAVIVSSTWFVEPTGGQELMMTQCRGLKPPVRSVAFASAPRSTRQRTTSSRACFAAWWRPVISFASVVSSPTPLRRVSSTISRSPLPAAASSSLSSGVRGTRRGGAIFLLRRRRKLVRRAACSPAALFFLKLDLMLAFRRSSEPERRAAARGGFSEFFCSAAARSVRRPAAGLVVSVALTVALLLPILSTT